jgi:hypothetical protein
MSALPTDIPGYNPDRLERGFFNPCGWVTQLLAVLAFAVGVWAQTKPTFSTALPLWLLFALLALAAAIGWLGGVQDRCWMFIDHRPPLSTLFRGWKRSLVVPLLLAAVLISDSYSLSFRTAFYLSHDPMQKLADAILAGHDPTMPQTAGIYLIKDCWQDGDTGVYLQTAGPPRSNYYEAGAEGFVYFPDGQLDEFSPDASYSRVPGDSHWYTFFLGR